MFFSEWRRSATMDQNNKPNNIQKAKPELSVVVLGYAAKKEIIPFVEKLLSIFQKNSIYDYELILVANYWPNTGDNTPEYVSELAKNTPNIHSVSFPKKGGMGWDMKSGLVAAQGDFIAVIDGDGQMPIIDLVRVYEIIKLDKSDLAKTYRITRGDGLWRKTISHIYNLFFSFLFPGLNARDINSKPKIFTRAFYEKLRLESDGWFIDAEIMLAARRQKARISEIPTEFLGLSGKRKSFVRWPAILEFIWNLIKYRVKEFLK